MNKLCYTALGDSITNSVAAYMCDGFAFGLYRHLKRHYGYGKFFNLGISGLTTGGLLKQLQQSQKTRNAVRSADIITITIGGNNLRRCTSADYGYITTKTAYNELLKFKSHFSAIMNCIRGDIGATAQIYVMTLFNPYDPADRIYETADFFICQLNQTILNPEHINTFLYTVVDVYSLYKFGNGQNWTFFNSPILSNPHPNCEGHYQIKKAFIRSIQAAYYL